MFSGERGIYYKVLGIHIWREVTQFIIGLTFNDAVLAAIVGGRKTEGPTLF